MLNWQREIQQLFGSCLPFILNGDTKFSTCKVALHLPFSLLIQHCCLFLLRLFAKPSRVCFGHLDGKEPEAKLARSFTPQPSLPFPAAQRIAHFSMFSVKPTRKRTHLPTRDGQKPRRKSFSRILGGGGRRLRRQAKVHSFECGSTDRRAMAKGEPDGGRR